MTIKDYGEKFKDHLLEQYKLYVEMADRISTRRVQANRFYISLLSGLLALLSVVISRSIFAEIHNALFLAVSILGLSICFLWYITINSYRQLNSGKFIVIHEIEQQLPFPCYNREWKILGEGKKRRKYFQLTRIEKFVPFILAVPYLFLFIYSLCVWL